MVQPEIVIFVLLESTQYAKKTRRVVILNDTNDFLGVGTFAFNPDIFFQKLAKKGKTQINSELLE